MEWKEIALGLLSVLNLFLGWWAHKVWARLDKQEDAHNRLQLATEQSHNSLRLFVAENYARKSEFDKLREWLDQKLDDLYDRMNGKADKP